MGLVTRNTKTGGNTTFAAEYAAGYRTIKASEVDADFTTLYSLVNGNLESTNLGANAVGTPQLQNLAVTSTKLGALAVEEAKIASDAVTTAKILNLNVTKGKLALKSVIQGFQYGTLPVDQSVTISTTPQLLLTIPDISTRGGYVLLVSSWGATLLAAGDTMESVIGIRRNGTPLLNIDNYIYLNEEINAPSFFILDDPGAGTFTYTIWGARVSGAVGDLKWYTPSASPGIFYAIELS